MLPKLQHPVMNCILQIQITDTKKPAQRLVFLLTLKTITLQQQLLG